MIGGIGEFLELGRKLAGGVWLKIHADDEFAAQLAGFLDEQFQMNQRAEQQGVGRLALYRVELESAPGVKLGNCFA